MSEIQVEAGKILGTAADGRKTGTEKRQKLLERFDVAKTLGTAANGRKTGTGKCGKKLSF